MPLPIVGVILAGGCVYVANKIRQRRQNNKITKNPNEQPSTLLNSLSIDKTVKSEEEIEINKNILLASGLTGLTIGGALGFPILTFLSIPGIFYFQIPFIKRAYCELTQEHKVGSAALDGVISVTMLSMQYFFASALFFTMYHASRKILLKTEDASRHSLIDIWGTTPQSVWIEREGVEVEIDFEQLELGDIIVINAGETIPVDGTIEKGIGNVDQHILTGESQLAEKTVKDTVFASTVLLSGRLYIKVDKAGTETVAAKIKHILNNTTDFKSSLQARGEQISEKAALPTLILGVITFPILGAASAAAVLLASFGSQMRITAPISILNFLKVASDHSILIKDGRALESLHTVDTVVFDKTGTLTQERPHIKAIHGCSQQSENEIIRFAAAAEYKQKHPIALAILDEAQALNIELPNIDDASYEVGYGLKVTLDGQLIRVGSLRFMTMENITIPASIKTLQEKSLADSSSLVYVAVDEQLSGAIELEATIRPEAQQIIDDLHALGKRVMIISGDHEKPTQQLAQQLGIDEYFAETLPENKAALIEGLQKEGRSVCFVGDGINDTIALKKANVSVSLSGASSIATDTAQVILMDESLRQLPYLFDLAGHLDKNLRIGFMTGLIPGIICVGGVYVFQIGVITAGMLYNIGLSAGVGNAMLAKLKTKKE
ncbi:MAG: heavy metal translocating P-type ATPase [Methylococcales bacterium]|nr:heavy metal translocating P-type ATPase [Methylococcales bacterium]